MIKLPEKLVIDRTKWCRQDKNFEDREPSALLTSASTMCCLGFLCKAIGLEDKEIFSQCMVSDLYKSLLERGGVEHLTVVETEFNEFGYRYEYLSGTALEAALIDANDCDETSDAEKEAIITKELANVGVQVEFIN